MQFFLLRRLLPLVLLGTLALGSSCVRRVREGAPRVHYKRPPGPPPGPRRAPGYGY